MVTGSSAYADDDRRVWLAIRAICATLILIVAATSASADTLRVGKAGREAFSFVPADIGARTGIFKRNGIEIEISSFGGDARLQQAMAADGIDVALGSGPGLAFIVKGSPVKGIAAMAGPPLLFALVVAGRPEALRGFLKGWFETITFMRKNKHETVEIAKEVMGTDAPTTSAIYDELMPMFSDTGRFDSKALAVLRKSFVEMKTLAEEPDMSKLTTEAFLPKAVEPMR